MAVHSVLIADSNTRLSQLVGQLLADEPTFQVLGVHSTAAEALRAAQEGRPDLVLLSERLEGRPIDDLCDELRAVAPDAAVIVWSHDPTSRNRGQAVADAVLERGTTFRQFVRDLGAIAAGARDLPAPAEPMWPHEHVPPLPSVPRATSTRGILDDPHSAHGLLLNCDSCAVQVRLATDDIAPAVDEARQFFKEHEQCDTMIDLAERRPARTAT